MDTKDRIVQFAEFCELELGLEFAYVSADMFEDAAICAESAEAWSILAFHAAREL